VAPSLSFAGILIDRPGVVPHATPFTYCKLEDASAMSELEALWPMKKFPPAI
jgi:hypothetical protein